MDKIIFNWKMNVHYKQIKEFIDSLEKPLNKRFVILPSYFGVYTLLSHFSAKVDITQLGLQNISAFPSGDYTSEVSFVEARELGVDYILVNHPEVVRNRIDDRNSENVNYKIKVLIENEFKPIICIGNEFYEKVADIKKVLTNEIKKLFYKVHLLDSSELSFVYMPYFLVNNNISISNREIEKHMKIVDEVLIEYFGEYVFNNKITTLYGGNLQKDEEFPNVQGLFLDSWNDLEYVKKIINTFNLR